MSCRKRSLGAIRCASCIYGFGLDSAKAKPQILPMMVGVSNRNTKTKYDVLPHFHGRICNCRIGSWDSYVLRARLRWEASDWSLGPRVKFSIFDRITQNLKYISTYK